MRPPSEKESGVVLTIPRIFKGNPQDARGAEQADWRDLRPVELGADWQEWRPVELGAGRDLRPVDLGDWQGLRREDPADWKEWRPALRGEHREEEGVRRWGGPARWRGEGWREGPDRPCGWVGGCSGEPSLLPAHLPR